MPRKRQAIILSDAAITNPISNSGAMSAARDNPGANRRLVMLNEKQKLAPDREKLDFGSDNNYEYKLYGYFSGDKVYEPASNTILPGVCSEKL